MSGLGGHINHLYDDKNLRIRDIQEIIKNLGRAKVDVCEKVDGQNLFVTWDFNDDDLRVARNKKHLKQGGLDDFGLRLYCGDRPQMLESFLGAYDAIRKSFKKLDHNQKINIFGHLGGIWFSVELVNPNFPNTIFYKNKNIIFHRYGPKMFSFDGEEITCDLARNIENLSKLIPVMREIESDWNIVGPDHYSLIPIDDSYVIKATEELSNLCRSHGISDQTTIRTYLYRGIMTYMKNHHLVPEDNRMMIARKLVGYPGISNPYSGLDPKQKILAVEAYAGAEKYLSKLLLPLESVVDRFSSALLSHFDSPYLDNPELEKQRLKEKYREASDYILDQGTEKQKKLLVKMNQKIGDQKIGIEGFVFTYRGKTYKVTGDFAPMNRIIASVKYQNQKREMNKNNMPLFISAG